MKDKQAKTATVELDAIVKRVSENFDYEFSGTSTYTPPTMPEITDEYSIGLIVGPSGTGKSTLLESFGTVSENSWDGGKAIVSHFADADDATNRLSAVGLNSIPSWLRPYSVLSTGEKFRADLARSIKDGAVVDEYTSVVDRNVARAASHALRRYVDKHGVRNVVLASCHYDIVEWLRPDWVFDTATEKFSVRGWERRSIDIELSPCGVEAWPLFSKHHYLDNNLNKSARSWLATWNGKPVGFTSMLAFPNRNWKNGWREHRTVVLPDFQGLGIGVRLSDALGEMCLSEGLRFFSKTSHPRMGSYRDNSEKWRPTSKNRKKRTDYLVGRGTKEDGHKLRHAHRITFSHEYVGEQR